MKDRESKKVMSNGSSDKTSPSDYFPQAFEAPANKPKCTVQRKKIPDQ